MRKIKRYVRPRVELNGARLLLVFMYKNNFFSFKVLTTYSCWCWCCFSLPSICIDPNSECKQHCTARGSHFIRFQLYVSSMLSLCWMPTPPPPLPFSCVSFLIRFISHHQHKSASCASLSRDSCSQCLIVIVFQFHLHWCAYPCWTLYCAFARAFQCSMLW